MHEERYLAIDYGDARVGTAVSFGTLAEPLQTFPRNNSLFAHISQLCRQHGITHLVVGQSEQEMATKSMAFAQELSDATGLPYTMMDETLSSKEVQARLRETRKGKKQYTGPIDHFAAAVILERFLEENL